MDRPMKPERRIGGVYIVVAIFNVSAQTLP